jgi:hypothetical protein
MYDLVGSFLYTGIKKAHVLPEIRKHVLLNILIKEKKSDCSTRNPYADILFTPYEPAFLHLRV